MAADSSSTAMELLKLLKERNDLTLLTNSAEAFHELAQSEINVVSTGGELNKNTLSLQGRITKEIISRYHVDIMVMSCKGLDMQSGALDSNEAEAEIKKSQCLPSKLMPQDIAAMVLFLASDDGAMCSSQEFIVDAGWV